MNNQEPEPTFSEYVDRVNQAAVNVALAFANSNPVLDALKGITRLLETLAESREFKQWHEETNGRD